MSPSHHLSHYFLGAALLAMNDRTGALREMREAVSLAPDTRFYVAGLGHVLARLGQREEAEEILRTFTSATGVDTAESPYDQAILQVGLGDHDAAIKALDHAVREHRPGVVNIKVDPLLAPLRSDPRFAALVRRAGLPSDP
jgi:tetratricopeptide (TPR) repeat protein